MRRKSPRGDRTSRISDAVLRVPVHARICDRAMAKGQREDDMSGGMAAVRSSLRGAGRVGILAASLMALTAGAKAQATINFWDQIWGPPEYIDTAKKLVEQFNSE